MRRYYLNFSDLSEDAQDELMSCAEHDIREDEKEMEEILDMYGEDMVDTIVSERAERLLYSYDFVFNI